MINPKLIDHRISGYRRRTDANRVEPTAEERCADAQLRVNALIDGWPPPWRLYRSLDELTRIAVSYGSGVS